MQPVKTPPVGPTTNAMARSSVIETQTPEEIAAQKAERSAQYRKSQTAKNLVFALLVTLGVVAIMILIVPRGTPTEPPSIDYAARAADTETFLQQPVLVPEIPAGWRVNVAELDRSGSTGPVWKMTLAPADRGFVQLAQAFDTEAWLPPALAGISPSDSIEIDGREWAEYKPRDPKTTANVSYGLGTQVGDDYVMLYGSVSSERAIELAANLGPQLDDLAASGQVAP